MHDYSNEEICVDINVCTKASSSATNKIDYRCDYEYGCEQWYVAIWFENQPLQNRHFEGIQSTSSSSVKKLSRDEVVYYYITVYYYIILVSNKKNLILIMNLFINVYVLFFYYLIIIINNNK